MKKRPPYLVPGKRIKPSEYQQYYRNAKKAVPRLLNRFLAFEDDTTHYGSTTEFDVQDVSFRPMIDVTSLDSVGGFREFIGGPSDLIIHARAVEWSSPMIASDMFQDGRTLPFKLFQENVVSTGDCIITDIERNALADGRVFDNITVKLVGQLSIEVRE